MRLGMMALIELVLAVASVYGQQTMPPIGKDVDAREVVRRGDMIEHITPDMEDVDDTTYTIAQIAATPDSDLDKWYLSVITQKGCQPCKQLLKDWESNQTLRAYAVPESAKDSWSHFTVYDYDDPLQSWRWKQSAKNPNPIKISAFPTIIVQPPRSGKYGKPSTVVLKYVWEGSPEKLHTAINGAIKAYVAKLEQRRSIEATKDSEAPLIGKGGFRAPETSADFAKPHGQQQFPPPLALPLDTQPIVPSPPEQTPAPARQGLISALLAPEIVVLKDPEQELSEQQKQAIEEQVRAFQPTSGRPYKRINRDVNKFGQQYGVTPDEAPVVLQVEGKKVAQKALARVPNGDERDDSEKGFVVSGVLMLLSGVMGYGTALMIGKLLNFVFWVVVILVGLLILVIVIAMLRTRQPAMYYPQPAPGPVAPPQPAGGVSLTKQQIAEIAAAVNAAQAKPIEPVATS